MSTQTQALTKDWYKELEEQSAQNFINLPVEFQIRGHNYKFISERYLSFFRSEDNSRQEKLILAKKFLKFIRQVNKNRARDELGPEFFMCFNYFMENFSDLLGKQDFIALEALSVITEGIDKTQFIEDIISVDDLKRRVSALKKIKEKEEVIEATWEEFEIEYNSRNNRQLEYKRTDI